jgi:hypothetical protein
MVQCFTYTLGPQDFKKKDVIFKATRTEGFASIKTIKIHVIGRRCVQ